MSDCPLTSQEIRAVISNLEKLEKWVAERETSSTAGQSSGSGYRRGGVADRGRVITQQVQAPTFPAIPPVAFGWKLVKEAGPPFQTVYGNVPYRGLEDGPGPVPEWVRDQADFVDWNRRTAEQRISLAFSAGFWARIALETHTDNLHPLVISEPPTNFIVLRAAGLGGYVRFGSAKDFDAFKARVPDTELIAQAFATETELSVFCYSARIALPALYTQC